MKQIIILTIKQTVDILREHGMNIIAPHLRAGLECGAYPFGVCIQMEKHTAFEVYKPLMMRWIEERSENVA